ncbi:MAG TPA: hypothetical protein VD887_10440 [Allosphingosinicella sp.]|nr:hypothetical protein [Allosphingosinicella sp.]
MLIGHYSASLAGRRAAPSVPLWAWIGAAQLLDILWCVFIMLGIERVAPAPHVTEGLAFLDYPWSHSLAAAAVWAGVTTQLARRAFGVPPRAATLLGLVVLSHWPLDWIVHRPDLLLAPGVGPEMGLGLWDHAAIELAVEIVLFLAAGLWLRSLWRSQRRRLWPLSLFLLFGAAAFAGMRAAAPPTEIEPVLIGAMGLTLYLGFVLLAWIAERASLVPPR